MKQRTKWIAVLLAALVVCGVGFGAAGAAPDAEEGSGGAAAQAADSVTERAQTTAAPAAFTDVPAGAWYAEAANWCLSQGILNGTELAPDSVMTRVTVSDALYRAAGSPAVESTAAFPDVPAGSQYADAAAWASANSVMSGYGNGSFGVDDPVTREQMASILWRYAGSPAADAGTDFADEGSIAAYAGTAVDWARANGIVNGREGNLFDPKGSLTRAQTAVILYGFLNGNGSAYGNSGSGSHGR